jgi:hypothetical protein
VLRGAVKKAGDLGRASRGGTVGIRREVGGVPAVVVVDLTHVAIRAAYVEHCLVVAFAPASMHRMTSKAIPRVYTAVIRLHDEPAAFAVNIHAVRALLLIVSSLLLVVIAIFLPAK